MARTRRRPRAEPGSRRGAKPARAEGGARAPARGAAAAIPVALGLALALAAAIHLGALRAPFFADDYLFLEQARGRSLVATLASPDPLGNFFRPIGRQAYFWVFGRAGNESPLVFHLANLLLFLLLLVVMFDLLRRLAGSAGAIVGVAFLSAHYALDVPILWASGSQDLIAATAAAAAIALQVRGRRGWAALAFAIGVLSKESVAPALLIALACDWRSDEPWWRPAARGWPLLATGAAWAALWLVTLGSRAGSAQAVHPTASGAAAALVHLGQVAFGLEWTGGGAPPPWEPASTAVVLVAAVAVMVGAAAGPARTATAGAPAPSRAVAHPLAFGLAWALLAALPVAAVADIWSAYFYVFALCGVALALGGLARRWPAWARVALVAAAVAGSAHARGLEEFATARGPWTSLSHVNARYLRRAMDRGDSFTRQLKALRPKFPRRATLFFAGLPGSLGWQTADGPVVRWAYRDSSLRSYFMSAFTPDKAARGSTFIFISAFDTLKECTYDTKALRNLAYGMILDEKPPAAATLLDHIVSVIPGATMPHYWRAWARLAMGDTVGAFRDLRAANTDPVDDPRTPIPVLAPATSSRDTAAYITRMSIVLGHASLTPAVHLRLAEVCLGFAPALELAMVEAYAYRLLAPEDPRAWRMWAYTQAYMRHFPAAEKSLERYFAIGGAPARNDAAAVALETELKRVLPGGDLAQRSLRR